MQLAQAGHRSKPTTFLNKLQIEAIAGLFFMLGFGIVAALAFSIANNPNLITGSNDFGVNLWAFLQNFGVLRPLLIIIIGVLLIRLGLRLRMRSIAAARWALSVLLWLLLLIGVGTVQTVHSRGVTVAIPWVLIGLICGGAYWTLKNNLALYLGEELIEDQYTRRSWNLLIPTLAIFIVVAISPLEQVFLASLTDERFASSETPQFVGLENYAQILSIRIDPLDCERGEDGNCAIDNRLQIIYPNPRGVLGDEYRAQRYRELASFDLNGVHYVISARDREFIEAAWTSLQYTVGAIFFQLVLGLFIAMILASRVRGIGYLRVAMLIPLAIPTLIATQFWDVMFTEDATGVINSILISLGVMKQPNAWLLDPSLQIPALILVIVWKETPGMALLLLPGLLSISKETYEAAEVDGLNRFQRFLYITLPLMRPTIGVALVLRTMVTLRVFDVFDILLGRLRFSMSTYAFETLTLRQQLGYSSAISVTIFLIILVFTVIYVRTLRVDEV